MYIYILCAFTFSFIVQTNACGVPSSHACHRQLTLMFGNGDQATCGGKANEVQIKGKPKIQMASADMRKLYTLIMVDADAPSRSDTELKYYLHWMVTSVKGDALKEEYKGTGRENELMSYISPSPPPGKDHRYQFYVAEQPPNQTFNTPDGRARFDLDGFMRNNGLCIVADFQYTFGGMGR